MDQQPLVFRSFRQRKRLTARCDSLGELPDTHAMISGMLEYPAEARQQHAKSGNGNQGVSSRGKRKARRDSQRARSPPLLTSIGETPYKIPQPTIPMQ